MNYLDIKNSIELSMSNISELRKSLDNCKSKSDSLSGSLADLSENGSKKINEAIEIQRIRYNTEVAKDYENKIAECIAAKSKLKSMHDKEVEKINSRDYAQKISKKYNIEEEKRICDSVKASISNFYGDDLARELRRVRITDCNIDAKNITSTLRLNSTALSKSFNVTDFMSKLSNGISYKEGDKTQLIIVGTLSAVLLILSIVAYPITLGLLLCTIGYNVYKSNFFLKCNSVCKEFDIKFAEIKELLDQCVTKAINDDLEREDTTYVTKLAKLDDVIHQVENARDLKLEEEKINFSYDVSGIEASIRDDRYTLENRLSVNQQDINELNSKLDTELNRLNTLKIELDNSMRTLTNIYMPKTMQLSNELPDDYLIDIKDNRPDILPINRCSCCFVYSELDKAKQFLHLLFYQTLLRTSPSVYSFDILDTINVDPYLSFYEGSDKDTTSNIDAVVKTFCKSKDIEDFLISCEGEVRSRLRLTRNYDSIVAYNKFMSDEECPTETYHFIVYFDPEIQFLLNEVGRSVITNGPKSGYYTYLFINRASFNKSNQDIIKLLDSGLPISFYEIDSTIHKRANLYFKKLAEL